MLFPSSVYAASNGGPLTHPTEWWSNPNIQAEFQQRLGYAIARFGHSTAVFSWQYFNGQLLLILELH